MWLYAHMKLLCFIEYLLEYHCHCGRNKCHDDIIKWKHFLCYWPFVWGIHRLPVNSPHKGQWLGGLISFWSASEPTVEANNKDASDLTCYRPFANVIVMWCHCNVIHLFGSLDQYHLLFELAYNIPIVTSEEITHWGLNNMADILQTR